MAHFLYTVTLFCIILNQISGEDNECLTPDSRRGKCVIINDCPGLFSVLFLDKSPEKNTTNLKSSHCGFFALFFPKVCCPLDDIIPVGQFRQVRQAYEALYNSDKKCGQQIIPGRYPWMALLEYKKPDGQVEALCGGVLINNRFILAPAHCVDPHHLPKRATLVSVRLGQNDDRFAINEIKIHENYDPSDFNQFNNIALLHLNQSVPIIRGFVNEPICYNSTSVRDNSNLVIAGWRRTQNPISPYALRVVNVTLQENSECSQPYRQLFSIAIKLSDSQICVGGMLKKFVNRDLLDFGGILMHVIDGTHTAIGIVARQSSCCGLEYLPVTYTKIANYMGWIQRVTEKYS